MSGINKINRNRLITFITVICMICSTVILSNPVTVSAASESHFVEAEKYASTNWTYYGAEPAVTNTVASGGKAMMLVSPANVKLDGGSRVKYLVNIQTPGIYQMEICRSPIGAGWTSNLLVSINGGEAKEVVNNGVIQSLSSELTKYTAQSFVLESGDNTIEFIAPEPRASDNRYVMYFDYFKLTNVEQGLTKVTTDAPWNVFQTNEEQVLAFRTKCELQKDTIITYDVVDYFGNMAGFGSVTGKKGESKIICKLKNLPTGHYTVTAKMDGTTASAYIAVVKSMEERQKHEYTPFAMTTTGMALVDPSQQENYAKILALSGITYAREHVGTTWMFTGAGPEWKPASWYNDTLFDRLNEYGIGISLMNMTSVPRFMYTDEEPVNNSLPDDLMDIYLAYRTVAEHYGDKIGMYEIMNEPDGGWTTANQSAALYTAIAKVGYIAIKDEGFKQGKEFFASHAAMQNDKEYFKELMDNEMFKYTDIYNTHKHVHAVEPVEPYYAPNSKIGSYWMEVKSENGISDAPIWITEDGMGIHNAAGTNFIRDKQKVQAQYHPENVVETIAGGADMIYSFIPCDFQEKTRQWGFFSIGNKEPYPVYVAYSVMTDVLGEAKFVGTAKTGDERVKAYWFDSGKNRVLAAWGTEKVDATFDFGNNNVKCIDIMGGEKAVKHNGIYKTTLDTNIRYYVIDGEIPEGSYTSGAKTEFLQPTHYKLNKAERVVLLQRFDSDAKIGARRNGYGLLPEGNIVRVQAYNFNEEIMRGTISGYTDGNWKVENPMQDVEIPPMSSVTLEFKVSADGNYSKEKSNLTFIGTFDGENTSKAVNRITGRDFATAKVAVENGQQYIEVSVKNGSVADYNLSNLAFNFNGEKYESSEDLTVKAGEVGTFRIAVENLVPYESFDGEVSVVFDGRTSATSPVTIEYNPLNVKNDDRFMIDIGALEVQDAAAEYGGETQGEIVNGADDLSGKFYIGNDSENIYIKGVVTDDIHCQTYTDANVWQGDGVQIGIGSGDAVYGDPFHELGLSLTPSGPQIYRWSSAGEQKAGLVTNGTLKVTRNESTKQTVYEAVIPLEELAPIDLKADRLRLAIVLNENDGIGRVAFLEWGEGIANSKNIMTFKDVLLSKAQD